MAYLGTLRYFEKKPMPNTSTAINWYLGWLDACFAQEKTSIVAALPAGMSQFSAIDETTAKMTAT
jgi:hypothetical protein